MLSNCSLRNDAAVDVDVNNDDNSDDTFVADENTANPVQKTNLKTKFYNSEQQN